MNEAMKDFRREPSKPHQCVHYSNQTGERCRAIAMHNYYTCYAHHDDDIPTVITNEPYHIDRLDTRDDIQRAFREVATRLSENRMDLRRAGLIGFMLQNALLNLNAAPSHVLKSIPEPIDLEDGPPDPELVKAARAERNARNPTNQDEDEAPAPTPPQTRPPEPGLQREIQAPASVSACHSERREESLYSSAPPQIHPPEPGLQRGVQASTPAATATNNQQPATNTDPIAPKPKRLPFPVPPSCFAPPEALLRHEAERAAYCAQFASAATSNEQPATTSEPRQSPTPTPSSGPASFGIVRG